jgi:transcriptional regulator of acetoin/glycerol metabolism
MFLRRFLDLHGAGNPPAVDPLLLEGLLLHDWPGNVRELDMLTQRLLALHGHEPVLRRTHLPAAFRDGLPLADEAGPSPPPGPATGDRDEHDRSRLAHELRVHGGNVTRAAAAAGLSRARAYRLMGARPAGGW